MQLVTDSPAFDQVINAPQYGNGRPAFNGKRVTVDPSKGVPLIGQVIRLEVQYNRNARRLSPARDDSRLMFEKLLGVLCQLPRRMTHEATWLRTDNDAMDFHGNSLNFF